MNRYGPKAKDIIEKTMHQWRDGELRSSRGGYKVRSRKQALAIGISKAREKHYKVPDEN